MLSRTMTNTGIAVAAVLLCAAMALGGDWGKVSKAEWDQAPPPQYSDINAAILFDVGTLSVDLQSISLRRHVRMKVFRRAGVDEIGDIHVYFRKGDRITGFKAQTILPGGKTVKVESRDIFTKSAGRDKYRSFAFPAVDSGCILEYQYENSNESYTFLRPWRFQSRFFTFRSQFALELAPGFVYSSSHYRPLGPSEPVEEDQLIAGNLNYRIKRFIWTQRDVPPVSDEPYMGAFENYLSALRCQLVEYRDANITQRFIGDWPDVGDIFESWIEQYADRGGINDLAKRLVGDAATENEKARRLYQWVADSISSRDDPEGSWFTHKNVDQLVDNGFGTGEEKNALLLQLIRKAGLTAWPVVIATRDHAQIDPNSRHLSQFNHFFVYAMADSAAMMLDASSRYCPYSVLPANCLVDAGLMVDGKDSKLIRIGRADLRSYRLDATDLVIDSTGAARCSTSCQLSGYFVPLYGELCDQSTPAEFVKDHLLSAFDGSPVQDTCDIAMDQASGQLTVTAAYHVEALARNLDSNYVFHPPIFYLATNPFKSERRSFPVDFNFPFTYHNIVRVSLEAGTGSATLPADTALAIPGVSFERQSLFNGGLATVDSRIVITDPVIEPGRYGELRRFFEQVAQLLSEDIILSRGR